MQRQRGDLSGKAVKKAIMTRLPSRCLRLRVRGLYSVLNGCFYFHPNSLNLAGLPVFRANRSRGGASPPILHVRRPVGRQASLA